MPFVGGPNTHITNPRWRTAAILEKSKNGHISATVSPISTKFGRRRSSAFLSRAIVKNMKFEKCKMAAAAILDFRNLKLLTIGRLNKRDELHRLAKFGRNRPNRGRDMAICRFFQDGGRPPSWICYVCVRTTHEGIWWSLSLCKIWLKSVEMRPRYGDFSIFQDGGRRHLGFFKFQIFNGRTAQEG